MKTDDSRDWADIVGDIQLCQLEGILRSRNLSAREVIRRFGRVLLGKRFESTLLVVGAPKVPPSDIATNQESFFERRALAPDGALVETTPTLLKA